MMRRILSLVSGVLLVSTSFYCELVRAVGSDQVEFTAELDTELRHFISLGDFAQKQEQPSISITPSWRWDVSDNADVTLTPYFRYDNMDDDRTHADIREFKYLIYWQDYELSLGIDKVFWGVTESAHLVDVINQVDSVESPDNEEKLGQPVAHFSSIKDWGTLEAFILPYFRERTYPGVSGRLRPQLPINVNKAEYESSDKQKHIDYALRYSTTVDEWDIGLSYLQGTDWDPYLLVRGAELIPYYAQMQFTGVDIQGIVGDWIWKLEATYKDSYQDYASLDSGFEYTKVGIFDSTWDMGLLSEYLYDSRGTGSQAIGQNDLFMGMRLSVNDMDSTTLLLGVSQDLDDRATRYYKLEGSTRLTQDVSLDINSLIVQSESVIDPLYSLRNDDYIEMILKYYF